LLFKSLSLIYLQTSTMMIDPSTSMSLLPKLQLPERVKLLAHPLQAQLSSML
jgi:hypothetical protein